MGASSGDLAQQLIEGGLTPMAARAIANALANAASPGFSQGRDISDSTPREALRLITPDTRRYTLTNLDYSPAQPFRDRLTSTANQFAGASDDHPYKDSQPVTAAAPLSNPRVQAGEYINVENVVENNSQLSRVGLRIRDNGGTHMRLNKATGMVESVPLTTATEGGFVTGEFVESETETQLRLSLRNLGFLEQWVGKVQAGSFTPMFITRSFPGEPPAEQPTVTYDSLGTFGRFYRIGPLVFVNCRLKITAISGGVGRLGVGGVPFPFRPFPHGYTAIAPGFAFFWVQPPPYMVGEVSANYLLFWSPVATVDVGFIRGETSPNLQDGSDLMFSMTYLTDA